MLELKTRCDDCFLILYIRGRRCIGKLGQSGEVLLELLTASEVPICKFRTIEI
jgi:hypothetical protein